MSPSDLIKKTIDRTRAYKLVRPVLGGVGTVLMFHRVLPETAQGPGSDGSLTDLAVTPELLETLIQFFRRKHYDIVSLDELHDRLQHRRFPRRAVCFTFDDGYLDNYTYAWPIFRQYEVPFAIYVTTCFPDKTATLWWFMIEDLVVNRERVELEHRGQRYTFDTRTSVEKKHAYDTIRRLILDEPQTEVREAVRPIFAPFGITPEDYTPLMMDWAQVEEMSRDPLVTIAAHTVNHYNLKQLPDDQLAFELEQGRSRLEDRLDREITHFAYPFGTKHEAGLREFQAARACGFKTMTTTRLGNVMPEHREHPEAMPRIGISEKYRDLVAFERNLSGTSSLFVNGLRRVITT